MAGQVAPYRERSGNTTGGWSGSEASRDRARRQAVDGSAASSQAVVLEMLSQRGASGATWSEVASYLNTHHGTASGLLSNLHAAGEITRLRRERRNKSSVYVLPEFVRGRETVEQGRKSSSVTCPHCHHRFSLTDDDRKGEPDTAPEVQDFGTDLLGDPLTARGTI